MKSKALSKEVRGLVSSARTKTARRLRDQNATERVVGGVGGTGGALLAAMLDRTARKKALETGKGDPEKQASFEVFGMDIPTNLAVGAAVALGGFIAGKGEVGAGMIGAGFTQANISIYRAIVDRKDEEDDEETG